MANRTVSDALSVKGTNPQFLIEKIIRSRIYDARYWKEECFALSAELLVDKAMALTSVGGVHGASVKPTPFLCLLLKMLQIQPEKDIVIEFIRQEDYKYVRALGAMYMRLVGTSLDCYKYLEPLYNDYRKIRRQTRQSNFEALHMDEFIEELLQEERVCDVILPRIKKRHFLEDNNELVARISALNEDLEVQEESEDDEKNITDALSEKRYRFQEEKDRNMYSRRKRSRSPRNREQGRNKSSYNRDNLEDEKHGERRHRSSRSHKSDEKKHKRRARSRSLDDDRRKHSHRHYKHGHSRHDYKEQY